jgi:AraC family transcriptional regulator
MTGCTVGQYIRRRRLTSSAHDLLHTRKRVIDIAVEYQFESQESYIRAFKAMFGVTPGGYRKSKGIIALYNPVLLNRLQKKGELPMQPNIVKRKFLLVGVEGEIDLRSDFSDALAALRGTLKTFMGDIGNRLSPERAQPLVLSPGISLAALPRPSPIC